MSPGDLVDRWRARAADLGRFAPPAAEAFSAAAEELEQALKESADAYENELLNPRRGSSESGYSAAHLRRLMRDGVIPNEGTAERPMMRRKHLPRRPGHGVVAPTRVAEQTTKARIARAVITGG